MLKRYLYLLLIIVAITSCSTAKHATSSDRATVTLQEDIVNYGLKYLGKPYRYAGKGPNYFDCSGFTSFVYKNFGYNLGASSSEQDKQAATVKSKGKLEKSDLVFFEGNKRNGRVGHVGIVVDVKSNGDFSFIHAAIKGGIIISKSTEPYYSSRYLRGGRVIENRKTKTKRADDYEMVVATVSEQKPNGGTLSQKQNSSKSRNQTVIVESDSTKTLLLSDKTISKKEQSTTVDNDSNNVEVFSSGSVRKAELTLQTVSTNSQTTSITHTVMPGETLFSISRKYKCTVEQLRLWNPDLGNVLKAGDVLRIMLE